MAISSAQPGLWRFALLATVLVPGSIQAQGDGTGTLALRVTEAGGTAIPRATVTISGGGAAPQAFTADITGELVVMQMLPGDREVLVEQAGFLPVRFTGVRVVAGEVSAYIVRLSRGVPSRTGPAVRPVDGVGAAPFGTIRGAEIFARRAEAVDVTADFTERLTLAPGWRAGLGYGNGLTADHSRVFVDGFEQVALRHPALPAEAPSLPALGRQGMVQTRYQRFSDDAAVSAAPGGAVSFSRHQGGPLRAWASYASSSLLARSLDNPADSSTSELAAGVRLGSSLAAGRGAWGLRAEYRKAADPSAPSGLGGVIPMVRRSDLLSVESNLTYRASPRAEIALHAAGATGSETNPLLLGVTGHGDGAEVEMNDVTLGAALTLRGEEWRSTTRASFATASREWTVSENEERIVSVFDATSGGGSLLPGEFSERLLAISEVLEMPWGGHVVAIGGGAGLRRTAHDWLPYSHPRLTFGAVEDVEPRIGHSVVSAATRSRAEVSLPEVSVFLQDTWRPNAHWRVRLGLRFESQFLPDDLAGAHDDFRAAFGVVDTLVPSSHRSGLGPRISIGWDPGGQGRTLLELAGGVMGGRYDAAMVSEVARSAEPITVTRAMGDLSAQPTSAAGQSLSLFGPGVRAPRHYVLSAALHQAVAPGTVLSVRGGYHHTDFVLRRENINLPAGPLAFDADGRAIWGVLDHRGALLAPVPGTNTRVTGFEQVWGFTSTGYSRQRFATVALAHERPGLALRAEYTWSRTEDNLLGLLAADPADRAVVIGRSAGADWTDGRSDLDVPHQVALVARLGDPGRDRYQVSARFRWRSGLPYTPGFAQGVDANADGSSGNDPVGLESVAGVRGLLQDAGCDVAGDGVASRNSCRAPAVSGLDVAFGYRIWGSATRRLDITLEGFNLVAGNHGAVDRAAVVVDPDGSISTAPDGTLVLPLQPNGHFGEVLARRTAPRTIRLGLRLEN